jgi:glyoxalase family protein
MKRFDEHNVVYNKPSERFGELYLPFLDPDGLKLELIVSKNSDPRVPWTTDAVPAEVALRGFHNVTLTLASQQGTAAVLTELFGYTLAEQHVNRYRYTTDTVPAAAIVDLVEVPGEAQGVVAGGSVHHVAFRVHDDAMLMRVRQRVAERGLNITPWIDRQYFHSLYFREPGGVLFELATDNPGFLIDEPLAELGTRLLLPPQHEPRRQQIVAQLPPLV